MAGLLAPICLGVSSDAEDSVEDRYRRAVQFFNEAKMEDACELLQQIEKETPGYKETHTYLNPACTSVKQAYALEETLFNEGVTFLNQQRLDEAKRKFTQAGSLVLKHPKYRTQIDGYLKQIDVRSREETLFQEAVQLFDEGKDAEASKRFAQIEQTKGTKAQDARVFLQRLKDRREDSIWNRAVDLFSKNNFLEASPLFQELVRMNGKRSGEAQDYLSRINVTVTDRRAFEEAVKVFNHKRYSDAAAGFQDLIQKGSPYAGEARSYLQKIDSAIKEESAAREQAKNKVAETGQDPKQVAKQFVEEAQVAITNGQYISAVEKLKAAEILEPGNQETQSLLNQAQELKEEQPLRQGLEAYFHGRYNEAEQQLGAYVDNQGKKRALARFFRGAAHASRYFLSGEQDVQQKELALVDFRNLRKGFQPPKQYVSPKILSLYTQATSARPQ